MKAYKQFLIEKLQNFFESIEQSLNSLLGYRDTKKMGTKVIRISYDNFYTSSEKSEFDNPDFLDGYMFVNKQDNNINIIQKLNLTKLSNITRLSLDETKEEIINYIHNALYYFDVLIGGVKGTSDGHRITGHVAGDDFRGYYKLDKILNEKTETNEDVYLSLELLLELKESTAVLNLTKGKTNLKNSNGNKVGTINKLDDEDTDVPVEMEPSQEDLVNAASELEMVDA